MVSSISRLQATARKTVFCPLRINNLQLRPFRVQTDAAPLKLN